MVAIKHIALAWLLILIAQLPSDGRAGRAASNRVNESGASLFAQSSAQALNREFPNPDISFLLLDARTGQVLASRWKNVTTPIPAGSLVKPFTALAYGEQHNFRYPGHTCRGTATGCWLPRGHGRVDLTDAIAHSCNSYFRMLTTDLTAEDVSPTAAFYGLDHPGSDASGPELAGLGSRWRISPLRLAGAYVELDHQRQKPGVEQILEGMAQSARRGTGAELHRAIPFPDALVKTGTSVCTHPRRSPGDGFAVVLIPADAPQILLMVRVHGVPGAHAAKTAGQMLRRIER